MEAHHRPLGHAAILLANRGICSFRASSLFKSRFRSEGTNVRPDEIEKRCYVCGTAARPFGSAFPQRIELDDGSSLCVPCARRLLPERVKAVEVWDHWETRQQNTNGSSAQLDLTTDEGEA